MINGLDKERLERLERLYDEMRKENASLKSDLLRLSEHHGPLETLEKAEREAGE